ncbi:GNAT family N-acetyltransferase [Marivita sp. S2033]|uniref:GNAT family N-acetyltransferase n=1 Tax=Marivita sp. S2033 TaxID=3373187 RepID=UPI003981AE4A
MLQTAPKLHVALARSQDDIRAAQRLRYDVFVEELGGDGPGVDHDRRLETDPFDRFADHLLLRYADGSDQSGDEIVGAYRLMTQPQAQAAGQYYSEDEFDLAKLTGGGFRLAELGRSCLHRDHRGGAALMALWQGVARYIEARGITLLFGVASFPGTDLKQFHDALSHLHHTHLAPEAIRVTSRTPHAWSPLPRSAIDVKRAMRDTPALIKSYLKLGGTIGQGVYVDHAFNTTDVCLILPTRRINLEPFRRTARRLA